MVLSSGFLPEMDVFGEAVWWKSQRERSCFLKACGIGKERLEKGGICFQTLLFMGMEGLRSGKD